METVDAGTSEEIDRALQKLKRAGVHGVIFLPDPSLIVYRGNIAEFAVQAGWPTAFQRRENVEPGGLLSYGASLHDQLRQAAFYVDRILKGAEPAIFRSSSRLSSNSHQPQDCKGTRPRNPTDTARPRRRGHPVNHCNLSTLLLQCMSPEVARHHEPITAGYVRSLG